MKTNWIIISSILLLAIVGLYFVQFNSELSNNQGDWAAFGGFVGGIAAVVNIGVFIWLTLAIQNAGNKQREKELQHQKRMIITQMRQTELIQLQKILFNKGSERSTTKEKFINELMLELTTFISTLEAFRKQKRVLFPILQSCDSIIESLLKIYRTNAGHLLGLSVNCSMEDITTELQITEKLELEAELLTILQNFIIDNINDQ